MILSTVILSCLILNTDLRSLHVCSGNKGIADQFLSRFIQYWPACMQVLEVFLVIDSQFLQLLSVACEIHYKDIEEI